MIHPAFLLDVVIDIDAVVNTVQFVVEAIGDQLRQMGAIVSCASGDKFCFSQFLIEQCWIDINVSGMSVRGSRPLLLRDQ